MKISKIKLTYIVVSLLAFSVVNAKKEEVSLKNLDYRKILFSNWSFSFDAKYLDLKTFRFKVPIYENAGGGEVVAYLQVTDSSRENKGYTFENRLSRIVKSISKYNRTNRILSVLYGGNLSDDKKVVTLRGNAGSGNAAWFVDIVDLKGKSFVETKALKEFDLTYSGPREHGPHYLYKDRKVIDGKTWLQFIAREKGRSYWIESKESNFNDDSGHLLVIKSTDKRISRKLGKVGAKVEKGIFYLLRMKSRKKDHFVFYPKFKLECKSSFKEVYGKDQYGREVRPVSFNKNKREKIEIKVALSDLQVFKGKSTFVYYEDVYDDSILEGSTFAFSSNNDNEFCAKFIH